MISIVIPTQDRPEDLLACLRGLAAQDSQSLIEQILIVDDNSRRPYREEVLAFAKSESLPVEMYDSPGEGAAIARNHATRYARGRILALLDDDAIPDPRWARTIAEAFARPGVTAITGRILPIDGDRMFARSRQMRYEMRQNEALRNPDKPVSFLAGGNSAVLRSAFESVGGFDTDFTTMHDVELSVRLGAAGYPVYYVHELLIHHRHYKGLRGVLVNSFRSAFFRQKLERKHPALAKWSLKTQMRSYRRLLGAALRDWHNAPSVAIAITLETLHSVGQAWYRLGVRTAAVPAHTEADRRRLGG